MTCLRNNGIVLKNKELFTTMMSEYFQHSLWGYTKIPKQYDAISHDECCGFANFSEHPDQTPEEHAEDCIKFMNEMIELGEEVYCMFFPENHPITNANPNIKFIKLKTFSTKPISTTGSVLVIYNFFDFFNSNIANNIRTNLTPSYILYMC